MVVFAGIPLETSSVVDMPKTFSTKLVQDNN